MHVLFIKQSDIGHILKKKLTNEFCFPNHFLECKKISEYDKEMPQSHTADQPTAP